MRRFNKLISLILIAIVTAAPGAAYAADEGDSGSAYAAASASAVSAAATIETGEDPAGISDNLEPDPENGDAASALDDEGYDEQELQPEMTPVTVVDSVEELAAESQAADNDPFFTIDVSKEGSAASLATEQVTENVQEILEGDGGTSAKKEAISEILEDSGLYSTEEASGSRVEVTSTFAYQRLRLVTEESGEINAYGAIQAVFYDDHYLLSYDSEEATRLAYEALKAEYGDDSVFIDLPLRAEETEDTEEAEEAKGWGTGYMGMDTEQLIAKEGEEVIVAVLDTGITESHEIFDDTEIVDAYDFVNNIEGAVDDSSNSHGTAVAGIIAESTPSNVKIMPLKVLDAKGSGGTETALMAIEYADGKGADIINLSLGGPLENESSLEYYENLFSKYEALIICASGNGETVSGSKKYDMDEDGYNEFPAELESTVCVAAISRKSDGSVIHPSFSNYGSAVDFAAPGGSLVLASKAGSESYRTSSGTSFATPYVSSAAALIKAEDNSLSNSRIKSRLIQISRDLGTEGKDVYFGYGCPVFGEEETEERTELTADNTKYTGISDKTYTGKYITQALTVTADGVTLRENTDYITEYENNLNAGTALVYITGIGGYKGTVSAGSFKILPKAVTPQVTLSQSAYSYTGGTISPKVAAVKDGSVTLTEGRDYEVTYPSGCKMPGTYTVTVELKGNYSGSGSASFTIGKIANSFSVLIKTATLKYSRLKKKKQNLYLINVYGNKGNVVYALESVSKSKYKKYFKVNASTGKVTVKKKLKKGTYKLTIRVTDTGSAYYASATGTVTCKVKVK